MFSIIDEGYFSLTEISQFFKGFRAEEVYYFLKKIDKGKRYLEGLIASAAASVSSEGEYITIRLILKKLGIEKSRSSLNTFIVAEMGGTSNLIKNYRLLLKNIAAKMIKVSDNSLDLLTKLGWLKGINIDSESTIIKRKNISLEIEKRIQFLFNTDFAKAKKVHTSGFIGKS